MAGFHVGDFGTVFEAVIKEVEISSDGDCTPLCDAPPKDISTAISLEMRFEDPDGTVISRPASFVTDGTDGLIQYQLEAGVLSKEGPWARQAVVTAPSFKKSGSRICFDVGPVMEVSS